MKQVLRNVYRGVFARVSSQDYWWQKPLLKITTDWASGPWLGMGLELKKLDDSACQVWMPARWKNEDWRKGEIHSGSLLTLGEYTARLYWERLLGNSTQMQLVRAELKILQPLTSDLTAKISFGSADREQVLFQARSQKEIEQGDLVKIYNFDLHLVAELNLDWRFETKIQKELPSRTPE